MVRERSSSPPRRSRRREEEDDERVGRRRLRDDRSAGRHNRHRDSETARIRSHSRSRSPEAKKRKEQNDTDKENVVMLAPTPKLELTKRELERLRFLKELEKKDVEDDRIEEVKRQQTKVCTSCPYLDTIDRNVLDFDFEKLCSVSLSTMNVYACMICGKYYQGRGTNTHAYTHALDTNHHIFLNLQTLKFYCLPDNYEIVDPSLEDIKYVLKPTYTKAMIAHLDGQNRLSRAYDDSTYFPGIVGLNNIKANDYCNVILHTLSHVIPLRNYFLQEENYTNISRPNGDFMMELPKRFGELIRKLWNPKAFRKHVSPHEMLQAVVQCSSKRFQITEQSDAGDFMHFLLNTLHSALNGTQKTSSSIVYKSFRGRMRQYSRLIVPTDATEYEARTLLQLSAYQESIKEVPFLCLSLDLPPPPLYRDNQMENVIPQVPLHVLLAKFSGQMEHEYKTYKDNMMKRFEILRLPEYLIMTYKRFNKNQWFTEKNPTIVNFPISNVDLYDCLAPEVRPLHKYTTYDLVANVIHDGVPKKDTHEIQGTYRVQILHEGSQKWFEMQDLRVEEILPQEIVLPEAYIQIWRMNRRLTREQRLTEEDEEIAKPIIVNPFNPHHQK